MIHINTHSSTLKNSRFFITLPSVDINIVSKNILAKKTSRQEQKTQNEIKYIEARQRIVARKNIDWTPAEREKRKYLRALYSSGQLRNGA